MTDANPPADVPQYASPDNFPNFDDVDSTTVELPDDSYDETAATDDEVND